MRFFLGARDNLQRIKVGDIYWDCAYHPVLCIESDGDDISGVSLLDGSRPRSCSILHCGVIRLNADQVEVLIRASWLIGVAEEAQRVGANASRDSAYVEFRDKIDASGVFPDLGGDAPYSRGLFVRLRRG